MTGLNPTLYYIHNPEPCVLHPKPYSIPWVLNLESYGKEPGTLNPKP